MLKCLLLFLFSLCASLALTPLVRSLALRIGAVDWPGDRKIHSKPIPRMGGVGVVLSVIVALLAAYSLDRISDSFVPIDLMALAPILLGALMVFVAGVWDDIHPLPSAVKFIFQAAGAVLAISFGVRIDRIQIFGNLVFDTNVLAVPLTFLWIVGITNAFNLIDGLDGLAAGLGSIAAGTCTAIFLFHGDAQGGMLLAALLGALIGFLRYNFNPAKIFLGDSGSLFIGYVLAVTAIVGSKKEPAALAVIVPLLVFGLPIVDTLLSMVRRFIRGLQIYASHKVSLSQRFLAARHIFQADQEHIHHRLIALGFSHRNAVLTFYGIALCLSAMALITVLDQSRNAGITLIVVGLATYIGLHKLGYREVVFLQSGTVPRWHDQYQFAFNRLFFTGFLDLVFIGLAYGISFLLKYEFAGDVAIKTWYLGIFPVILLVQLGVFFAFGLYRGIWRATGINDLVRVAMAVGIAVTLSLIAVQFSQPPAGLFAFICIDLLMLGALMVGARSAYRIFDREKCSDHPMAGEALIYGAGRGGQLVVRELLQNARHGLRPIGFIDDDRRLWNRTVNQVPVLGSGADVEAIHTRQPVAAVVVSSTKIHVRRLQELLHFCRNHGISVLRAQLNLSPVAERDISCGNDENEKKGGFANSDRSISC